MSQSVSFIWLRHGITSKFTPDHRLVSLFLRWHYYSGYIVDGSSLQASFAILTTIIPAIRRRETPDSLGPSFFRSLLEPVESMGTTFSGFTTFQPPACPRMHGLRPGLNRFLSNPSLEELQNPFFENYY